MASREYFLKQAELCLRLARNSTDEEFSQRLMKLAAEYQEKASAPDSEIPDKPDEEK